MDLRNLIPGDPWTARDRMARLSRRLTFGGATAGLAAGAMLVTAQPAQPHTVAYLRPAITATRTITAAADRKAFTRYVNHPTYPHLVTLVETTLALRTGAGLYSNLRTLRADVLQLAADVEGRASAGTVQTDEQYAGEDLYGGA